MGRSMRSCLRWRKRSAANSGKPVHVREFVGIDHGQMIKGDAPVSAVGHVIRKMNGQLTDHSTFWGNSLDTPCPSVTVT